MNLENCCPAQKKNESSPEPIFLTSGGGKWSLLAFAMNSEMAEKPGQLCGYFWM